MDMTSELTPLLFYPAEKAAIALESQPTYVFNIDSQHCNGEDKVLAATCSNNSIQIYNRQRLGPLITITGHDNVLTGVKFSLQNPHLLFSSSVDGSIRCWDLRTENHTEALKFVGRKLYSFCSFDVNCDNTLVCAGTQKIENDRASNALLLWDCRTAKRLHRFDEFHTDDITQVKFHPERSKVVATGGSDNLICLLDFNEKTASDALLVVLNCEFSVGKINWCGPNHNFINCVTDFNTMLLWDANETSLLYHFSNIQDQFASQQKDVNYLIDCFHYYNNELVIVGGSHNGLVHFLTIKNKQLVLVRSLSGGHSNTIRDIQWDQETESLVTGGEDAMLCLWKPGSVPEVSSHQVMKMPSTQSQMKGHISKPY